MEYRSSTKITNSSSLPKTLILEPWGEEYAIPAGKTFEFYARADQIGDFEIDVADNALTIYLWSGATVKIFCDGEEIGAGNFERPIVPDIPTDSSVSSFLKTIFGTD